MKPKRELMAALRSRRQREGWVRIEVWVPAAMVAKVRVYVRKLTKADQPCDVHTGGCDGRHEIYGPQSKSPEEGK